MDDAVTNGIYFNLITPSPLTLAALKHKRMTRKSIPAWATAALLLLAPAAFAQKTYLHCGRLLDVRSGKLLTQQTIVVERDRITAVQSGYTAAGPQDKVVNLENRTVLPGLIDTHVHLESSPSRNSFREGFTLNPADVAFRAQGNALTTLRAGFTTVRDCGGSGVNTPTSAGRPCASSSSVGPTSSKSPVPAACST